MAKRPYEEPPTTSHLELINEVRAEFHKYTRRALHAKDEYNRRAYLAMATEWAMILTALT